MTTLGDEWLPWLRLSQALGIGRVRSNVLLERYGTPENVFAQEERALVADAGLPSGVAAQLVSAEGEREAKNERARLEKLGVQLVHLRHPDYPELLREIHFPPVLLGRLGTLVEPGRKVVAIVGSRNAGLRALRFARNVARDLAEAGIVVASGLARGIDRAAHEGALDAEEGRTIAVLGCGLARVYPSEHAELAARIKERGALVSEFAADASPSGAHFPMRNRIIAGLALGTLVIAAGDRSGALITAAHSIENGREVFAVPGPVDDPLSRGTNKLLKESGAHLVEGADDVLLNLELKRQEPNVDPRPPLVARRRPPPLPGVPGEVETYLAEASRPCTFEEIVFDVGIDARAAISALGILATRRRIQELPGIGYAIADA
jgi:DNA processing protein